MLNISFGASQSFNIENSLFSSAFQFSLWLFVSLESDILHYMYIMNISPIPDVKIFSQSIGCHFVLSRVSFALEKNFNFMRSHLSILDPLFLTPEHQILLYQLTNLLPGIML